MFRYLNSIVLLASLLALTPGGHTTESHANVMKLEEGVMETDSAPQLFRVTKQRPWPIVGEGQFSIVLKTTSEKIGGVLVQEKILQCSGELPLADIDFYYMRRDGQLHVRTELLALQYLFAYSVDGRTFAYRAAFVKVNVGAEGRREYIGAVFILYYYDEDGDGKFETRYGDLTSPKLPEWYKGK